MRTFFGFVLGVIIVILTLIALPVATLLIGLIMLIEFVQYGKSEVENKIL